MASAPSLRMRAEKAFLYEGGNTFRGCMLRTNGQAENGQPVYECIDENGERWRMWLGVDGNWLFGWASRFGIAGEKYEGSPEDDPCHGTEKIAGVYHFSDECCKFHPPLCTARTADPITNASEWKTVAAALDGAVPQVVDPAGRDMELALGPNTILYFKREEPRRRTHEDL